MLHLTRFGTDCIICLSPYMRHIHLSFTTEGEKVDGGVGKCAQAPSKSTNTRNRIPANAFRSWPHGRTKNRRRKSNGNTLFQLESTYVYPQMSADPESTEWSYEHIMAEHKHFIPRAHVISRSWSWRTAGIMGTGLATAISIFPFAGSKAMASLEQGGITRSGEQT